MFYLGTLRVPSASTYAQVQRVAAMFEQRDSMLLITDAWTKGSTCLKYEQSNFTLRDLELVSRVSPLQGLAS